MKILLKGYYGFGNLGDDILMLVSYKSLKKKFPDVTLDVFSNYTKRLDGFEKQPDYNTYIHHIIGEQPRLIDWTYHESYDLLVDGGGGIYFGHTAGRWYHRILNVFVRLFGVNTISRIDTALRNLTGKQRRIRFTKHIGWGIGIGEYKKSFPELFRQFSDMGSYTQLMVRDAESKALLKHYKYRGVTGVYADLAFLHTHWVPNGVRYPERASKKIAIILLDFEKDAERTMEEIQTIERRVISAGYEITYFSLDDVKDKLYRSKFHDRPFVSWQPSEMKPDDFFEKLAQNQVVITARAHGAILGACLGVIPIIIPHSQKLVQVSRMFPASAKTYEICLTDALLQTLDFIFFNLEACRQAVASDVEMNKIRAEAMVEAISTVYE